MIRYFLYARKSTDKEDRQILSIESQIAELGEFAKKENLTVVREFTESKTAKEPGRGVFNEMLKLIEKGKADGIIAWHPDRLARNSVDGGKIIYLIDIGKIKNLKFPTYKFDNSAYGKFILTIAFGQSKYYVDSLSENTKRGLREKLRRGEWPGWAPVGYLNDLRAHKIILDPDKHKLVKKLFELYATGKYSIRQMVEKAKQIKLTSKTGKDLSRSEIEHILKNPFYYGVFRYKGEIYEATHPPIITKELFDKVQEVFKQRSVLTRDKSYNFVFRGFIKCGECGAMITAEIKKKKYIYCYCTKRKGNCSQPFNTTEEDLLKQIILSLSRIWPNNNTTNRILQDFERHKQKDNESAVTKMQQVEKELEMVQQKLDRLFDGYVSGLITSDEYHKKKEQLIQQKMNLTERISNLKRCSSDWFEPAKEIVLVCNSVEKIVKNRDYPGLVELCQKVGSNYTLFNKKLNFSFRLPFDFILKNNFLVNKIVKKFLNKNSKNPPADFSFIFSIKKTCPNWLPGLDSNQQPIG